MALLNIGKKKNDDAEAASGSAEVAAEVPDELPDLPADGENAPQPEAVEGAPDELPPVGAELAPDELPPMGDLGADLTADPMAIDGAGIDDKRLYFSQMLQKLHEEGIKSTKLTSNSVNFLQEMKKHWKEKKRVEESDAMMQKVAESVDPLKKLEQEWVALQNEIEQKKEMMHSKEEEIKKLVEDVKKVAAKAEKMNVNKQ